MQKLFFILLSLISLGVATTRGEEPTGMTARFIPDQVKPGDLFTLSIEMHRDSFGQFTLSAPSHPRLHLVTREKVPPKLINGRYHQEERLILQALSSGPLNLSGFEVELTETEGTRKIILPVLSLDVLPFDQIDNINSPHPFPKPTQISHTKSSWFVFLLLLAVSIGLAIYFLRKKQQNTSIQNQTGPNLAHIKIRVKDFEHLLEEHRNRLSPDLQDQLESFLYAPKQSALKADALKDRLQMELNQ